MQRPVQAADLERVICPTKAQLVEFAAKDGRARGEYRDGVISACVKAINRNYADFKHQMHNESTSTRLTAGILTSGAAAIGSFARADIGRRLAAGSSFVLGTSAAIDKDVFFQQTLPALEASMDANREQVLARIVRAQRDDPDARTYDLVSAGNDLDAYEGAGNLCYAVSDLTRTAAAKAEEARERRLAEESAPTDLGYYVAPPEASNARYVELRARVRRLRDPEDAELLDRIVADLGLVLPAGASFGAKRDVVLDQIYRRAVRPETGTQQEALDALEKIIR